MPGDRSASCGRPANPYLYTVRSSVKEAGQVVDVYETPFGIRDAIFDAERGFLLNGEHIKINGVCLHQEAGAVGAAVPERDVGAAAGAAEGDGLQRHPHQPQSSMPPEFLDLCDRMGFLVMNEAFDEWKVAKGQIEATATTSTSTSGTSAT